MFMPVRKMSWYIPVSFFTFLISSTKSSRILPSKSNKLESSSCSKQSLMFHGDPLPTGTVNLYLIFIGKSSSDYTASSTTPSILQALSSNLSNSTYAHILVDYYPSPNYVPTFVYAATAYVTYTSSSLSDDSVSSIVENTIQQKGWSVSDNTHIAVTFRGDYTYCSHVAGDSCWNIDWCGFHSTLQHGSAQVMVSMLGGTVTSLQSIVETFA